MPLDRFAPPGNLDDLTPEMARGWSDLVEHWINVEVRRLQGGDPGRPVRFFNERARPVPASAAVKAIPWDGFPKVLKLTQAGDDVLIAAERLGSLARRYNGQFYTLQGQQPVPVDFGYRNQDEYLEWLATPGAGAGQIAKVTFTCEPPEYWQFIAGGTAALAERSELPDIPNVVPGDRGLLLKLYRKFCGDAVQPEDLLHAADVYFKPSNGPARVFARKGDYNPYNKWNTTQGIVHLTHPSNTLRAEINLAAGGTVLRKSADGSPVTDTLQLICCSGYGNPNRSSDPTIGSGVNGLSRSGLSVTLRDPIGLYLNFIDLAGFEGPGGEDVSAGWHVLRGSPAPGAGASGMVLRAEFTTTAAQGFRVDQVLIDGAPVRFGGQIANKIGMVLSGKAFDSGGPAPSLEACSNHCCRSPEHPDFLAILDPDQACSLLDDPNQPGRHWGEAFPGPLAAGGPSGLVATPAGVAAPGGPPVPAGLSDAPHALTGFEQPSAGLAVELKAAVERLPLGLSRRS
jgi:hypothetical protein